MAIMYIDMVHPSMEYKYKLNGLTMTSACLDHKHGISCLQCLIYFCFHFNFFYSLFLFSGIFLRKYSSVGGGGLNYIKIIS